MGASLLDQLHRVAEKYPLERKVLICSGYAEGHQLLEQLCRSYGPVLNMEVQTLRGLAAERARIELSKRGWQAISRMEVYWITYGLLQELPGEQSDFLAREQLTPGLLRAVHQALQELREAGVESSQLAESLFDNPAKGRFVRSLLQKYERILVERRLADDWAIVRMLPEAAAVHELVIAREAMLGSRLEREAFARLSGGHGIVLSAGLPFTDAASGFPIAGCRMFQANGALAEAREVLRRMLEKGIPWDQSEIILSDYPGAIAAVHSAVEQVRAACTYAEGLPIRFSKAGQAALHMLDWMESDYNAKHLIAALRGGVLTLREAEVSSSLAARVLEESGVGWGQERYAGLGQAKEREPEEAVQKAYAALIQFLGEVWAKLPEGKEAAPGHILKALCEVVEKYARWTAPEEHAVLSRLQELRRSSDSLQAAPVPLRSAVRLIRELLETVSYRAEGIPGAGALHVSSMHNGGLSGRPFTFVLGMNERVWRLTPKQDPVLLDAERARISPDLRLSSMKAALVLESRLERLGAIRGSCTLSYSAYDLAERREQFPAYELLQLYRQQAGRPEADFEEMKEHLGALAGYSPSYGRSAVDEADVWLKHLVTAQGQIRDGESMLYGKYPNLLNGAAACEAREVLPEATVFDGLVNTSVHELEFGLPSGKALSASRLELYARCPMQFYFREVLRLPPKEAPEFDRTRWLNAMERGSLLHEIFERYYAPWAGMQDREVVHDRVFLNKITEETIEAYAVRVPAPSLHVREKEAAGIRRDADIFFRQELSRPARPVYLELQLHRDEQPFMLQLSNELTLPLRGFVDRVDRLGPHRYRIVDYKTGKPGRYKEQEYFAGGTQLQHALYALAVEQWLKRTGTDPEAEVVEAAYYFPTERGLGEELVRVQNRKDDLAELLHSLLGSMRDGVFPPTREAFQCSYCDYSEVCGRHASWMRNKDGERLQLLQEVYGHA